MPFWVLHPHPLFSGFFQNFSQDSLKEFLIIMPTFNLGCHHCIISIHLQEAEKFFILRKYFRSWIEISHTLLSFCFVSFFLNLHPVVWNVGKLKWKLSQDTFFTLVNSRFPFFITHHNVFCNIGKGLAIRCETCVYMLRVSRELE